MTQYVICIVLAAGALGYTPVMDQVALNRYTGRVPVNRKITVDPASYDCKIGVPGKLGWLVGKEVFFIPQDGKPLTRPWLVADYEAPRHAGYMTAHGLLGDVSCPEYNHKHGVLVLRLTIKEGSYVTKQFHPLTENSWAADNGLDRVSCSTRPSWVVGPKKRLQTAAPQ